MNRLLALCNNKVKRFKRQPMMLTDRDALPSANLLACNFASPEGRKQTLQLTGKFRCSLERICLFCA